MTLLQDYSCDMNTSLTPIVGYISDDQLHMTAFSVCLKRVAVISGDSELHVQQVWRATQVLWDLLKGSNYAMRRMFAHCVASELQLIGVSVKGLCAHLESHGKY